MRVAHDTRELGLQNSIQDTDDAVLVDFTHGNTSVVTVAGSRASQHLRHYCAFCYLGIHGFVGTQCERAHTTYRGSRTAVGWTAAARGRAVRDKHAGHAARITPI